MGVFGATAICFLAVAGCGAAFEVLYAGAPRTGTQTMYTALKILGMNPLHAGYEYSTRPPVCEYLFGDGSRDAAMSVLAAYDAAMDEPMQFMYEDVIKEYPNAKVILPIIDVETWYQSEMHYFEGNIFPFEEKIADAASGLKIKRQWTYDAFNMYWENAYRSTFTLDHCWACRYWDCAFWQLPSMSAEQNQTCKNNYEAHMDRVKAVVPADRLLLFNFSDGWAPLCHFLGRPIPDEEFPYTDMFRDEDESETELAALPSHLLPPVLPAAPAATSFLQDSLELHPTEL